METVKAVCNWTRIGGCDWSQAIQTNFVDDEFEKPPETDEIIHEERSLLLRRKMKVDETLDSGTCEIQLAIFPRYKISNITMISTVSKVEVFLGAQNEYYETEHGCSLDDDQSLEYDDAVANLRSYRYDIKIKKSGISEITMKLLTNSDEICIFALLLHIAPNPNGITTLLPSAINLENVQKMLENSNQRLTPNAEKCKKLMQMFNRSPMQGISNVTSATVPSCSLQKSEEVVIQAVYEKLKISIDKQLREFESKLLTRLDAFENKQSTKLDEILKLLQQMK